MTRVGNKNCTFGVEEGVHVCACVTLRLTEQARVGRDLCYVLVHVGSHQVAPLHVRHLFLEVGVHVSARSRSLESSLRLLILSMVHRKVAAAAAAPDRSRTSELFIWPSDPHTE